jgi:hypothetical protein
MSESEFCLDAAAQAGNLLPGKRSRLLAPGMMLNVVPISFDNDTDSSVTLVLRIWQYSVLISSSSAYRLREIGDWHTDPEFGQKQA